MMATPLIKPLAWEPPYAMEAALEMAKRQKKKKKEQDKMSTLATFTQPSFGSPS